MLYHKKSVTIVFFCFHLIDCKKIAARWKLQINVRNEKIDLHDFKLFLMIVNEF